MISQKKIPIIVVLSTILVVTMACSLTGVADTVKEKVEEQVPSLVSKITEVTKKTEETKEAQKTEETKEAEKTEETKEVPQPTATTPPAQVKPLVVSKVGFGQDDTSLGLGFIIENPNTDVAISFTEYRVAAYDAADVVVETQTGYIDTLLPGQKTGIGDEMYLDEGKIVAKIEIQIKDGTPVVTDVNQLLTASNARYRADDYYPMVYAEVANPFPTMIDGYKASAILYDTAGNIIGGGWSYASFVPANESTSLKIYVSSGAEPANVEVYALLPDLSYIKNPKTIPIGASELKLVDSGFGEGDYSTTFAYLVQNPNADWTIVNSQVKVMVFAADNSLLDVTETYLGVLLPNETFGYSGDFYLPENTFPDHIKIQTRTGTFENTGSLPNFTYENVTIDTSGYSPKVTGVVVNPYPVELESVSVYAVIYDAASKIIGGGFTYVDFIPASAKAAVDMYVNFKGTPASVELYAMVSNLKDIQ